MTMDRRILLPATAQILALVAPFLYLRVVVVNHGAASALSSELILSMAGFFAIAVDWSSMTFLSRTQARLLRGGAYFSILAAKLLVALVLFAAAAVFLYSAPTSNGPSLVGIIAVVLLAIAIDPSWIHVGRGLVWVPPALSAFRFVCATLLSMWGIDPILALALSFCLGSVIFLLPVMRQLAWPGRLSWRLPVRVARRYYLPTFTDLLTAAFSRLDVALAAFLLSTDQALSYAVSRKLIVGLMSIAFSSSRLFYLERDAARLQSLKRSLVKTCTLIVLIGVPCAYVAATKVFLVPGGFGLQLTLGCLAMLIPLGYAKTIIQFSYLYQSGRYGSNFAYSVMSLSVFVLSILIMAISGFDSVVLFSLIRVSADATYVTVALISQRIRDVLG